MTRLGVTGISSCFLWLCSNGIILADKDSQSVIALWSYRCLRGYNCTGVNQFTFESGRRSLLGQGEYQFKTKGQENTEINRLIKQSIAYKFTFSDDDNYGSLRGSSSAFSDYDKMDQFIEYSVGHNRSSVDTTKSIESVTSSKLAVKRQTSSQSIAISVRSGGDSTHSTSLGSYKSNEWISIKNMKVNNSTCRICSPDKISMSSNSSFSICPNCQSRSISDRNLVNESENNAAHHGQPRYHRDNMTRVSVGSQSSLSISRNSQQIEDKYKATPNPDEDQYATFYKDSNVDTAKYVGNRHANLQDPETVYDSLGSSETTQAHLQVDANAPNDLEQAESTYDTLAATKSTPAQLKATQATYAKLEGNETTYETLNSTEATYDQLKDMQDTPQDSKMRQQSTNASNHQRDSCRSKVSYRKLTSIQDAEYETFHLPQDFENIVTINVDEAIYDNLSEPFSSNQSQISYDNKDINHDISPHMTQSASNVDNVIVDKSRQLMDNEANHYDVNDAVYDSFANTSFKDDYV